MWLSRRKGSQKEEIALAKTLSWECACLGLRHSKDTSVAGMVSEVCRRDQREMGRSRRGLQAGLGKQL